VETGPSPIRGLKMKKLARIISKKETVFDFQKKPIMWRVVFQNPETKPMTKVEKKARGLR